MLASELAADPLTILEVQLKVGQPDLSRVTEALTALAALHNSDPSRAAGAHARLSELLAAARNPAAPLVFGHLLEAAAGDAGAGAVIACLLRAGRAELRLRAASALPALLQQGMRADDVLAGALEELAARAGPISGDVLQTAAAALTEALGRELGAAQPTDLLGATRPRAVRLLAARVLDAAGVPAAPDVARLVLGETAWHVLASALAYTRATHRELVELTPGVDGECPSARSLAEAAEQVGEAQLGRILAELRWARVVWGVSVEPVVALCFDDNLPVMVRPAEAALLERCQPARRLWQGHVLMACGSQETGGDAAAGDADAVRRFRRYNLTHAELLSEILDLAPVTCGKVRHILSLLDEVTQEFAQLFADADPEATLAVEAYAALRAPIAAAVAAGDPAEPVTLDVARQVQRFEDPRSLAETTTLHGLKRYLHQRGLRNALRRFRSGGRAERTVDLVLLRTGEPPVVVQRIRYADLEPETTSAYPPPAVKLIAAAFERHLLYGGTSFPSVLALLYGTEVQVYVQYRNHPAFVRLDLSPPRRGGMIDLEYFAVSQYELAQHPARDVPAIRTLLQRAGFHVQLDGVRLHARYDKESAADQGDLLEHAAALFALLPHLMDLDWTLGSLQYPRAARAQIAEQWAELFLRLGALPAHQLLASGGTRVVERIERVALGERAVEWEPDRPYEVARRALLPVGIGGALSAELERIGWSMAGPMERAAEAPRLLERGLFQPLGAALARGELTETEGELRPVGTDMFQRVHEADHIARLMLEGGTRLRQAVALAARLRQLERELRLRVTGAVNGWPVELAVLRAASGTIGLALLRDDDGMVRLASAAADAVWYRTRGHPHAPWGEVRQLDPELLVRRLLAENCLAPDRELELFDAATAANELLAQVRASPGRGGPGPRTMRSVAGRIGSPGRASGFARIRTAGTLPVAAGVLVAPDIGPGDARLLREADAVVSTGGGVLSHIGLLALELGKPSLIVEGTWRTRVASSPALSLARTEYREEEHEQGGLTVLCRTAQHEWAELVRDGDLLVVDAELGELQLLGAEQQALALHDGLRALADVLDPRVRPDSDPLALRGDLIRVMHQLEKLTARLQRPDLADYLVHELCLGPLAARPEAAPHRRRLLALLQANPSAAGHAAAARGQLKGRVRAQLQRALAQLRLVLPTGSPLEVLHSRLIARRAAERLRDLEELEGIPRHDGRESLDEVVTARLEQLRRITLTTLTAERATWRLRHELGQIRVLDAVLPAGADAGERGAQRAKLAAADAVVLAPLRGALTITGGTGGLELAPVIGSKAANLGEVARVLGPGMVPAWFVVTDAAFRQALPSGCHGRPLAEAIDAVLRAASPRVPEDWERLAARIRQLWLEARLPPALEAAILAAYRRLCPGGEEISVAVRSSALEEDSPAAAWAGQFDTFLCIRGGRALLEHVRLAWAGLWSSRALHHRSLPGALPAHAGGGIIVQRMVEARVAGVVQTVCAAAGRLRELVINAALGLGEGVVAGTVGVDEVHVLKPLTAGTPLQLQYRVGDKRDCVRFDVARGSGTRREDTLYHQRLRPALEYTEINELVDAALALERAYGQPLDIEFAFEQHSPLILQARPIPLFHAALRETVEQVPLCAAPPSPQPELTP